jgi:hypothetical protein
MRRRSARDHVITHCGLLKEKSSEWKKYGLKFSVRKETGSFY